MFKAATTILSTLSVSLSSQIIFINSAEAVSFQGLGDLPGGSFNNRCFAVDLLVGFHPPLILVDILWKNVAGAFIRHFR